MRILGLDPGIATTGFGLVEAVPHLDVAVLDFGVVTTPAKTPVPERLAQLHDDLTSLLQLSQPDLVVVERLYFYRMGNIISVAQARGVALLAIGQAHAPLYEYSPPQVKQALTGYGNADKQAVQEAVQRELNLTHLPKPDDAADGLALCLTWWFLNGVVAIESDVRSAIQ